MGSDYDQLRLTKSSELTNETSTSTSKFCAEAWNVVCSNKQMLTVPAAILGLSLLPIAFREGTALVLGASARTAAESSFARALRSGLAESGENLLGDKGLSLGTSLDFGKSLSEHFPSAFSAAGKDAGAVSVAQHFEPILPHYSNTVPVSLTGSEARDIAQKYIPGQNLVDWVNVNGEQRQFMVHVPKSYNPDEASSMVVALDGFLVKPKNPFAGMAHGGGMIEQSDKLGFVAVFPVPKPRYGGQIFSWNESTGSTNFLGIRPYSDSQYIQEAMQKVMAEISIDSKRVYGVGFSQGSLQLHDLVSKSPEGTFKAIATIAGTTTDKIAAPPAGTKLMIIHSEGDPVLNFKGGVGWFPRMFDRLGWNYASESKPFAQVQKYLDANGITAEPTITKLPELTVRTWNSASGETFAQELLLNGKYGHTIPGSVVDPTDTFFTVVNGIAADKSVLNAKQWITESFFKMGKSA